MQPSARSCLLAAHGCCVTHCCALLLLMRFRRLLRSSFDHCEPGSALLPHLRLRERGGQTAVKMKETCHRTITLHYPNQAERPVPSCHPASLYALAENRHNFVRISMVWFCCYVALLIVYALGIVVRTATRLYTSPREPLRE